MKFHYYKDTDSLYIELSDKPGKDVREIVPGVVLDFDAKGKLVGIDIDKASKIVNLSEFKALGIPSSKLSVQT